MGRDVAGLRIDNKRPNAKSNGVAVDRVHVAPKIAMEKVELKEHEVEDQTARGTSKEESQDKQDVLGVKSTNTKAGVPEGKTKGEALKPSEKKLSSPLKPAPETVATESLQTNSFMSQSPELSNERRSSHVSYASETENIDAGAHPSSDTSELSSPLTAKKPQPNSPLMSRKPLHSDGNKKHHDDEDNYSLASSGATSVRTIRSKVTVGVAPTFKSAERAHRRREYYMMLEEKHKALEAEKQEFEARTKEEEEAAIQQLRKTMVYKANPVPSFYREGPPPKVELKKLPVTRAKSPNLTRRKSCSDAVKSSPDEKKACARGTRHSIGVYKNGNTSPATPKNKDLSGTRNVNGPSKFQDSNGTCKVKARPKQVKDTTKTSHRKSDQMSTDIPVVEETKNCYTTADHGADIALLEDEKEAALATNKQESADITAIEGATKTSHTATEQRNADVVQS